MCAKQSNRARQTSGLNATTASQAFEVSSLELLKEKLLEERMKCVDDPILRRCLTLAASEAMALAWTTAYPLLMLPELLAEGCRLAQLRFDRQNGIRQRSRSCLHMAA